MQRIVSMHCVLKQRPQHHHTMAVKFVEVMGCTVRACVGVYITEVRTLFIAFIFVCLI